MRFDPSCHDVANTYKHRLSPLMLGDALRSWPSSCVVKDALPKWMVESERIINGKGTQEKILFLVFMAQDVMKGLRFFNSACQGTSGRSGGPAVLWHTQSSTPALSSLLVEATKVGQGRTACSTLFFLQITFNSSTYFSFFTLFLFYYPIC